MMDDLDRLYQLMPEIYRILDEKQRSAAEDGQVLGPLRAYLRVINEQLNVVEQDIAQLYENWFIETCQAWAIPYIGDLIDYQPRLGTGVPGDVSSLRSRYLVPRSEVGNTIGFRRRKGTLALLPYLTLAVSGWPAHVVEFYRQLGWTQNFRQPRLERGRYIDFRREKALERPPGPFNTLAHRPDMRSRFNLQAVGVFVWRLEAYPVSGAPARPVHEHRPRHFHFSVLGNNISLFVGPDQATEQGPRELAFPVRIRREAMQTAKAITDYYGETRSLSIGVENSDGTVTPIAAESIVPADLSRWDFEPEKGKVAVDPELGRIAFAEPPGRVRVRYYHGFSTALGGGEYPRTFAAAADTDIFHLGAGGTLADALTWAQGKMQAVIEIAANDVYLGPINFALNEGQALEIRAAVGNRPVLRVGAGREMTVTGKAKSRLRLDGLLIEGQGIFFEGPLDDIHIRHCTIVPGGMIDADCTAAAPLPPSLDLPTLVTSVTIEHSIVGTITVRDDSVPRDQCRLVLRDSIVDAVDPRSPALAAPHCTVANVRLSALRCTVLGAVLVHAIDLAENSIFAGKVTVNRSQHGCVRFCYVLDGSRTPRRYECQPDLITQAGAQKTVEMAKFPGSVVGPIPATADEQRRVQPRFTSTRYGAPGYCQLADDCAAEIRAGADDESEMGVFHNLFQSQRAKNLQARLDEFTPAAFTVDIIFAS